VKKIKKILFVSILFVTFLSVFLFKLQAAGGIVLYFSPTSDNNWDTAANWYSDADFATPRGAIPSNGDTVFVEGNVSNGPSTMVTLSTLHVGENFHADLNTNDNITVNSSANFDSIGEKGSTLNGTIYGPAFFYGNSKNNGTVVGEATFDNRADNRGTVTGDAMFIGNNTENNGTVNGTKTRYYNTNITPNQNFTGIDIITADSATVNLFGSTNYQGAILSEINVGHFVTLAPVSNAGSVPIPVATSTTTSTLITPPAPEIIIPTTSTQNTTNNTQLINQENNPIETSKVEFFKFTKELSFGENSSDVKELQKLLNFKGFALALNGNGSPGNETNFFRERTKKALILFQKSAGLPATGYFGKKTINYVNSLIR